MDRQIAMFSYTKRDGVLCKLDSVRPIFVTRIITLTFFVDAIKLPRIYGQVEAIVHYFHSIS